MKTILLKGQNKTSSIVVGESLKNLTSYIPGGNVVIIVDKKVYELYRDQFPGLPLITINGGERSKSLKTIQYIVQRLVHRQVDRSSYLVGIGGGVVCDLTGFAASIYMRGLSFGLVATTLLSQVDASVGGKNGVNFQGYKNLVGCFHQPDFVLCDYSLLHTLPKTEIVSGLAEMVKHGLIASREHWDDINKSRSALDSLHARTLERLLTASISIKAGIVEQDEHEAGARRILNFGHTLGHAIEKVYRLPHGKAVSLGMIIANRLSVIQGILPEEEAKTIENCLKELGIPVHRELDYRSLLDAIMKDKKKEADRIHVVLLKEIGKAIVKPLPVSELRKLVTLVLKKKW